MKQALFLLTALATPTLSAQILEPQWLRSAGNLGQFQRHLSAVTATGHIYTVVDGTNVDYGDGVVVAGDGYVLARYDSTGTLEWARAISAVPDAGENVAAIAITSAGDIWVAGGFAIALTIDGFELAGGGSHESFMALFDTEGVAQQAFSWGGPQNQYVQLHDMCIDAQDHLYVTGQTDASSFTIGGFTVTNTAGGTQLFTLGFAANGTTLWCNLSTSPDAASGGRCIAVDPAGNTYVVGHGLGGVMVVDDISLPLGDNDMTMLLIYDNTGALAHMETMQPFQPWDIVVDDAGQAYVCGHFGEPMTLAGETLVPYVNDGFVAAFPGDGTCAWVVTVSGEQDNEACYNVVLNAAGGALLVGGAFTFDAWFGPLFMQTGMHPADGFIMHLGTDGTVNWVQDLTGDGPTLYAQAMYDTADRVHASGVIQSSTTYLGQPVISGGGTKTFLARFEELVTGIPTATLARASDPYPNPSNGTFAMDLPADVRAVTITDAQGRTVAAARPLVQRPAFHLSTPGVYAVQVITDAGSTVHRVVVE